MGQVQVEEGPGPGPDLSDPSSIRAWAFKELVALTQEPDCPAETRRKSLTDACALAGIKLGEVSGPAVGIPAGLAGLSALLGKVTSDDPGPT